MSRFETIGLVGRTGNPGVIESLHSVLEFVAAAGLTPWIETRTAAALGRIASGHATGARRDLGTHCDLLVVVGGDGSLLGVARDLMPSQVPVVGVNRGGLGFLAAIAPDQITEALTRVLAGDYVLEQRFLLEASVQRDGSTVASSSALNDVVVHAGTMARMIETALSINGDFVYDQRSDGLIISSPTGSTAYALSAGGPIMHPDLDAIVVVPMFPHTLTARPIVVPGDALLEVTIGPVGDSQPQVSCDSQVDLDVRSGDVIRIRKYPQRLNMVFPSGHSFYESCRSKLDWGSRLGGS